MSDAAKSGLNVNTLSYNGSHSTLPQVHHFKQINKNNIERDYSRDNVQSAQGQPVYSQNFQKIDKQPLFQNSSISQQQQKRSLTKSLSQNKLLLVSPETILNSNNAYHELANDGHNQDKNSFSEQSLGGCRGGNPSQELLFKQHLQYSSNHTNNHTHQQNAWQLKAKSQILSHMSTKECTYCNKTLGVNSNSHIPPYCSAIYCIKDSVGMMIQNNLSKKYSTNRDYYNLKIVNDLIYNENTHIVSIFKDFLILDDINEFLKRSYTQQETKVRLPKLCSFYDKYSQVFPNYVILPESKYMFKNIQRKQKLIDEQYQLQEELSKKQHQTLLDDDKLFNSKFYNSVYKMDISMSRQQYEDQAKSIASVSGRPQKQQLRIDQMKIDELVDRFLLKDSESNIQLITTAGLDFSGFTMHGQSIIMNEKVIQNPTPNKQQIPLQNIKQNTVQLQQTKVNQQIMLIQKSQQSVGQRKESLQQKKQSIQPPTQVVQENKKTKGSFNYNQQQKPQQNAPKLDTQPKFNGNNSQKTTPRLQKSTPYTVEENKKLIQTSPGTKEALQNYLSNCQIDDGNTNNINDLQIELLSNQPLKYENNAMLQSPQFTIQKLLQQNSQTALSQQMPSNSLGQNSRHNIKSQCAIPTLQFNQTMPKQEITNLKKTTRLSSGNLGQQKQIATTINSNPINKKQNASPNPAQMTMQSQQQFTTSSRNIVSNQTQKSLKSVNSHAKYLSGGVDQYQRLLSQQNVYTTHETVHSNQFGSSNKKMQPHQLTKQDMIMDTFQSKQTLKNNFIHEGDQAMDNDGAITGEDCDDCGIADERFASPDIFTTNDDALGRKSINHRQLINAAGGFGNPVLLTSCEDNRILSQCNNYDQIKKHLEQYITISQQDSNQKKYIQTMSNEKYDKNIFPQTGTNASQQQQDMNNSRNGTAQKHFESLKQKIRGVFEVDGTVSASANKTPNKSSTHSKKSHMNQQPSILQQNRMSIESKDMMLMIAPPQNQGCLSSTSAAGRTLSFAQFNNNQANYRSITNMQQRKNSNQKQESSIEQKRLSQNRQSFKEMQNEKIKRSATGKTLSINDINQHTFGNIQNQSGTPYLQQIASSTTLGNPNFIQAQNSNKASYQTHHQQQNSIQNSSQANYSNQQAAGTVRVMTPSYSLASLSKIISPTQSTSPITMTVTLASQGRKQPIKKQVGSQQMSQHQHNPSNQLVSSSSHQNFIISDKNSKMIQQQKQQISNTIQSKSNRSITNQQQFNQSKQLTTKNINSKPLQQSSSQENFTNITPRGQTQPLQQQTQIQPQYENSQNLSQTISTENNSTKAIESKNPKFMRTIEEYTNMQQVTQYNNMLSASLGHRKSGTGLSIGQPDLKQKQKIQTVVNSNQTSIKRTNNQLLSSTSGTQILSSSTSISHFKSPSQQIHQKKQSQGNRYV